MAGVLYISYDGMLEPLGQSQVLAYLKRLVSQELPIHLISFEKPKDWENLTERNRIACDIASAGIVWHPLQYHKTPSGPATAYDIAHGTILGIRLVRLHDLKIVHARSYVPSAMALNIKRVTGAKFLFDMRGFWADERVDSGAWDKSGNMYRVAKWFERQFLLHADHVVSLTHAGVREMQKFEYLKGKFPPMTVIPTCADLERFKPLETPARDHFTLGYVGTAGTWYVFDKTVECFAILLRIMPDARILIVNRGEYEFIRTQMQTAGIPEASYELVAATFSEMPNWISKMDVSIFFIRQAFSKQASAPTKLAELLGCGVPCLANSGVGDMADILRRNQVGVVVNDFLDHSLEKGIRELVKLHEEPEVKYRCRITANEHFSLQLGIIKYKNIYNELRQGQ